MELARGVFVNVPVGVLGLAVVLRRLPDYREPRPAPLDFVGLVLFGTGVALLSYVLEIFGEHSLTVTRRSKPDPLLRLDLLRIRTVRVAVSGGFIARVAIGGVPSSCRRCIRSASGPAPCNRDC